MPEFLKNHPFAVEAFFESSVVLTFAVSKEQLQVLLPPCLAPDTFNNNVAFIAAALVQTKNLRPKGWPVFMGSDFFLIGYRIFVRYVNNAGRNLRGLYILASQTDKRRMEYLGNIFTHYNYTTTDILLQANETSTIITSADSGFNVTIDRTLPNPVIPPGSPFKDWKDARRFAGPLPFTFTFKPAGNEVLIIEGVRQNWIPAPISISSYHFDFINNLGLKDVVLANAFEIKNVPYHWKKGVIEKWQ